MENKSRVEFKENVSPMNSPINEEQILTWVSGIKSKLGEVDAPPNVSIYKVPKELRAVNENAYSPCLVSIGPFHRDRIDLQAIKDNKWRYMLFLVQRTDDPHKYLEMCARDILALESEVRENYEEKIKYEATELAEIMLVDACFILELFLRYKTKDFVYYQTDPVFNIPRMIGALKHDLALIENQIPFFVLDSLYNKIVPRISDRRRLPKSITDLVFSFFEISIPETYEPRITPLKHLLHLLHDFYLSKALSPTNDTDPPHSQNCCMSGGLLPVCCKNKKKQNTIPGFNRCATRLLEAGIEFEREKNSDLLLDISFRKGVIKIPQLQIKGTTESLLRNLIAFEHCSLHSTRHITSYAFLLKSLISSSQDIELLEGRDILINVGGAQDVLTLFNNISNQVVHDHKEFCFRETCEEVNAYRKSYWHWHRHAVFWKVKCRRYLVALKLDYFSNPWTIMSIVAAVVLFVLTGLQTYYAIHPSS